MVSSSGNVGIGTTSPSTLFHIHEEMTNNADNSLMPIQGDLASGDLGTEKVLIDITMTDANAINFPQVKIGAAVGQNSDANSLSKEGSGAFVVYTSAGTSDVDGQDNTAERMRVDYLGNVGIGTATPSATLHLSSSGDTNVLVEGNITASGNISASGNVLANTGSFNNLISTTHLTVGNNISASGNFHTLGGVVNTDEVRSVTQTTNKLILEDDQTLATNMVSLMSVNFLNLIADGNNNGTGKVRILDGNYDVDSATEIAEFSPEGIDFNAKITASGDISSSTKITSKELLVQAIANNVTPFNIRNVDGEKQLDLSIDSNQHSELGIFKDGGEKIKFNSYWPAIIDNDFYETGGGIVLGSDVSQNVNRYGIYISAGPDSGSAYFAEHATFNSHITASGNISSSGIITGEGLVISDDALITDDLEVQGNISGSSASTITIGGKLQAGSKSFLINKPEGGKVEYGVLDGQQNDVFYRGELKGDNVIHLPQECEWLVDENTITIQLTSIGKHQELYIKEIK